MYTLLLLVHAEVIEKSAYLIIRHGSNCACYEFTKIRPDEKSSLKLQEKMEVCDLTSKQTPVVTPATTPRNAPKTPQTRLRKISNCSTPFRTPKLTKSKSLLHKSHLTQNSALGQNSYFFADRTSRYGVSNEPKILHPSHVCRKLCPGKDSLILLLGVLSSNQFG